MNKKNITRALPFSLAMSTLTTLLLTSYDSFINHLPMLSIRTLVFFIVVFFSSFILAILFPNVD